MASLKVKHQRPLKTQKQSPRYLPLSIPSIAAAAAAAAAAAIAAAAAAAVAAADGAVFLGRDAKRDRGATLLLCQIEYRQERQQQQLLLLPI